MTADIVIVAVPAGLLTYLSGTRDEDDATWWSQTAMPPLSVPAASFTIQRNSTAGGC